MLRPETASFLMVTLLVKYGANWFPHPTGQAALGSAMVVNSYPGPRVRVQWSYEEESPGRDARGFGHEGYGVSDPEGTLVNAVLGNGARLYVDHAHPEYSAPEAWDPGSARRCAPPVWTPP